MPHLSFRITTARTISDFNAVSALFKEYAGSLGIDLGFQDFGTELATLPGKYAPPHGELLLARHMHGDYLGCVGLRPFAAPEICEVKRLYVTPSGRGLGVGRALADAIVAAGWQIGYHQAWLDTLPSMIEAIALYRKAGFRPIPPYYETPVVGTIFLGRTLDAGD